MNYEQIKTDYPKAWQKWIEWDWDMWDKRILGIDDIQEFEKVVYGNKTSPTRYMYDFFDNEDIHVLITMECLGSQELDYGYEVQYLPIEHKDAKRWVQHMVTVKSFSENGSAYVGAWYTRTEAEEAAFEKAFFLLEKQLNG